MAITYALGPNPKWYFTDAFGKPLAGGKFFTYRSLNKAQFKFVFTDPNGNFPWPDPVIIDANGTAGPFWFQIDSTNPSEQYFIVVQDANGVEQWTQDNYLPNSGGGGGGGTTIISLENIITNNVYYRHNDVTSPVPVIYTVAPSNFTGLVGSSAVSVAPDNPGPDILFVKNNISATDAITYPTFILGSDPIVGDVAPVQYFNYTCTIAGTSETVKCLQFPITNKVQNLQNTTMSGTFWARSNGGTSNQITLQWFQFFGDGAGASVPVKQIINVPFTLTSSWVLYNFNDTVPDVTGKTLGGCGNDGLFLQVVFPLDATCNIDFVKLTLYEGTVLPDFTYTSFDFTDSVISLPRTGDILASLNGTRFGWVLCNDGVIARDQGPPNPVLTPPAGIPQARYNLDTYPLYNMIWTVTSANPDFAPIYDNTGAVTTRGASAIADFTASKQLSLTKQLGRALSSSGQPQNITAGVPTLFGTNWPVGQTNIGEQTHQLTIAEMPAHNHPGSTVSLGVGTFSGGGGQAYTPVGATPQPIVTVATQGGDGAHNTMQPTSFYNIFLKL